MNRESALLKKTNNQIAVQHGLPPIGALMTNQYGIEWLVDGHIFAPTLSTIARQGVHPANGEDPRDLYPVVLPQNLSPRLDAFLAETDRCTSKVLLPLDTLPFLRPHSAHPHGHWIDGLTSPHEILMFLDAAHVHETVIAHELGHIWIDVVEDCEDYRILNDLSDTARVSQWTSIQSFVLDNKVNEVLRERGFDMSVIENDVETTLASLSYAVLSGYRPPSPREAAFLGSFLATAMLDYETGAADALQSLDMATMVFQRDLPEVYQLACQLATSVRRHGYSNRASIRRAIDECALLSFAFVGDRLHLDKEMVEETPTEAFYDKYPDVFPNWSVQAKLEVARAMAKRRIPAGSECRLSYVPSGNVQIQFAITDGWTEPIVLENVRRMPNDLPLAQNPHFAPEGRTKMNRANTALMSHKPTPPAIKPPTVPTSFMSVSPPQLIIPVPNGLTGRRSYAPGLARFLSEVRLAEQLGGEHLYGYAFNNPTTYTDPSGLEPCQKKPYTCDTYPGGPCAYAKSIGADKVKGIKSGGGVVCCNGVKYACFWQNYIQPGIKTCALKHESCHKPSVSCPPRGFARPDFDPGISPPDDECKCYQVGLACLHKQQKVDCGKLTGQARKACLFEYKINIDGLCDAAKKNCAKVNKKPKC